MEQSRERSSADIHLQSEPQESWLFDPKQIDFGYSIQRIESKNIEFKGNGDAALVPNS